MRALLFIALTIITPPVMAGDMPISRCFELVRSAEEAMLSGVANELRAWSDFSDALPSDSAEGEAAMTAFRALPASAKDAWQAYIDALSAYCESLR
jgi:hypothetical protein